MQTSLWAFGTKLSLKSSFYRYFIPKYLQFANKSYCYIFSNYCQYSYHTFFKGIVLNLLPKQPFIIAISFQIIANTPTTLFIKGIGSNLLPKQLFVAKGFNHFFPSAHQ
jgi:hypothetical protein